MKIPLRQKIILIISGICSALIFIEIGLRLAGWTISFAQERRNRQKLERKSDLRIMCLGESTTQNQYPELLEKFLNKSRSKKHFSVIDKGVIATNTFIIASKLEENIKEYKPDIVVSMIGINDYARHMPEDFNSYHLKTYKLFRLLLMRLRRDKQDTIKKEVIPEAIAPQAHRESNCASDSCYFLLGKDFAAQGKTTLARQAYKNAIKLNPDNIDSYFNLVYLSDRKNYNNNRKIFERAMRRFKALVKTGKIPSGTDLQHICATFTISPEAKSYLGELELILKKILNDNPGNTEAALNLAYLFLEQNRYPEAEKILNKCAEEKGPLAARKLDYLAILYHNTKRLKLSEQSLRKANNLGYHNYAAVTAASYLKIKTILDKHGIQLVCVQYPMRKVSNLKKIFPDNNSIAFVDNETVFKNALRNMPYKYLFYDTFAGDFGHCTPRGNKILAKNIAKTILKITR